MGVSRRKLSGGVTIVLHRKELSVIIFLYHFIAAPLFLYLYNIIEMNFQEIFEFLFKFFRACSVEGSAVCKINAEC